MARLRPQEESTEYNLPAHRLTGTQAEVLVQIDELTLGLTGLRQLVSLQGPRPADAPRGKRRLARRFLTVPILLGAFGWVPTATAQTTDLPVALKTQAATVTQEPADPNPGALTLSGGIDVLNRYMFRGIRQHSTGVAIWPWADVGVALHSGNGGLKSADVNVGTWNSLHSGDTGTDGPSQKLWYESDFYASLGLGFGRDVSFATTYTAYTSPNNTFSSVTELMFRLAVDDSQYLGRAAITPYVIVARELDTAPGLGQADGGAEAGTYLEVGIAPGYAGSKASVAVPVKIGLSLSNYYELAGSDDRFGFFSVAGIVTVPIGSPTPFGGWNIHGGAEFQRLGDHTAIFNGGDRSRVIGSIGIGFSY